jgi:hypothetical protein
MSTLRHTLLFSGEEGAISLVLSDVISTSTIDPCSLTQQSEIQLTDILSLSLVDVLGSIGSDYLEQEGFRWRADDGNEAGASWIKTQDLNITLGLGEKARLRAIINSLGDYDVKAFQLEYKKTTDLTWLKVT